LAGNPVPIVFDGQAIWISGSSTDKLYVSSGAVIATFAPTGELVFDGASIWVGSDATNSLSRL
jgi:hypothetical protein